MKILYPVTLDSFFAQAGQSVAERTLLDRLLAQGVGVRLVAFGEPDRHERMAREAAARYAGSPLELLRAEDARSPRVTEGIDALVLHSLPDDDPGGWLEDVHAKAALPIVQYIHSFLLAPFEQTMYTHLWRDWDGSPPARLVAPSHRTAARAEMLGEEVRRRGGRLPPVVVIPLGVDADAFAAGDRAEARARLGLAEDDLVVLSVGRITQQKAAYTQLVLAFHSAVRQAPAGRRPVLVIAGAVGGDDGPYRELLVRQVRRLRARDRVHVVENFDDSLKAGLYAAGDVFVSLANDPQESFGLALLEAMGAGLPVLATDWNGYPETLPAAYAPHLVPTLASHALARALDWRTSSEACAPHFDAAVTQLGGLLADERLRARLAAAGPERVAELGWERATAAFVALVERLAAEPSTPAAAPAQPARSMVEGLASRYLDDDPRLRIGAAAGRLHGRQERWMAAHPLQQPRVPLEEQQPWMRRRLTPGRRAVLRAAAAAGPSGVPAAALRERTGLPVEQADLLLLRLVRFGLLDVAEDHAPPGA